MEADTETLLMVPQRFTDEQVTEACNLHVDNLRKLITWGAVIPAQAGGGRGRVRLWTMGHVRRISITASIQNAGFSLRLAHTIAGIRRNAPASIRGFFGTIMFTSLPMLSPHTPVSTSDRPAKSSTRAGFRRVPMLGET